ncbi:MAG: ribonuclease III [Gammaproteobacteria bacterium]
MSDVLAVLCRHLGYQFAQAALLDDALTHRSAGSKNNERLEFLGDAILNFTIAAELYRRFELAAEGELSRLRASLVNAEALARLARELSLGECLTLGSGEMKSGGFRRESILADALEAVFGAVYLDGGFEACRNLILRLYHSTLESLPAVADLKDPKTQLQEFLQSRKLPLPTYQVVDVSGEPHNQTFVVECQAAGVAEMVRGRGSSRRKAEQDAAGQALRVLRND